MLELLIEHSGSTEASVCHRNTFLLSTWSHGPSFDTVSKYSPVDDQSKANLHGVRKIGYS